MYRDTCMRATFKECPDTQEHSNPRAHGFTESNTYITNYMHPTSKRITAELQEPCEIIEASPDPILLQHLSIDDTRGTYCVTVSLALLPLVLKLYHTRE